MRHLIGFAIFLALSLSVSEKVNADWKVLEQGLELGSFHSDIKILKIDTRFFNLHLLNASSPDQGHLQTAKQWCKSNDLVAGINTSMYLKDYKTSISLMKTSKHVNNPRLSGDKTILAFEKLDPSVPDARIIDRGCESFEEWKGKYGSFVQSIRMISCKGENVWQQQPEKWSIAALGIDKEGDLLFIHSKTPFSTHDFINLLLSLPIRIDRAMYAEGGAETQLYINSRSDEYEFIGVPEATGSTFQFEFKSIPIPNLIGIRRAGK